VTRVLVLTAVAVEARGLARHLGLSRVPERDWPSYRGGHLEVAGVGFRAARLDERVTSAGPAPALVVSAGACGALAPTLAVGDLVVPEAVVVDGERVPVDGVPGLAASGTLLSVASVIDTPAAKARLWMETGALAVDMESGPIVAWARRRGARVVVVRGVSDTARDAVPADLAALVEPGGRVRTAAALRAVLARPRAAADAIALARGTSAALRSVAVALATLARS
jgi:adenosylhomocysteine nucleosidase